jgi:VIT1/CCC1 family predicted Fe2+/Mn2+ transporter
MSRGGWRARPLQASWASALAFSAGAVVPVISVAVALAGARAVAMAITAGIGALVGAAV